MLFNFYMDIISFFCSGTVVKKVNEFWVNVESVPLRPYTYIGPSGSQGILLISQVTTYKCNNYQVITTQNSLHIHFQHASAIWGFSVTSMLEMLHP